MLICKNLDVSIDFNMKTVDDTLIPNLKELILKIIDLKREIGNLQASQLDLVNQEDQILCIFI